VFDFAECFFSEPGFICWEKQDRPQVRLAVRFKGEKEMRKFAWAVLVSLVLGVTSFAVAQEKKAEPKTDAKMTEKKAATKVKKSGKKTKKAAKTAEKKAETKAPEKK